MDKKLGLTSVVATGVGLILSTGCLMSLGQGSGALGVSFMIAMFLAALINIFTALSLAELNALLPNLTGGLAQYTLTCLGPFFTIVAMVGGYLVCNILCGAVEVAMFGNVLSTLFPNTLSSSVFGVILLVFLIIVNLHGIDMFAKIQNIVAYSLIGLMILMGVIGIFNLGTGTVVEQPMAITWEANEVFSMVGLAFFLFLGCEFIIPISKDVKNAKVNVPLGMVISILIVLVMDLVVMFGMSQYTPWNELGSSLAPHLFYGTMLLGDFGAMLMGLVSVLAAISSINSVIGGLAYISAGMSKINLLPKVFQTKNKCGAPKFGLVFVGGTMILLTATGIAASSELSFFILIGCVFWMVAYIIASVNVLVLRVRLPKAPRTFKVPFGWAIPIMGIVGNVFMIINIDPTPEGRMLIHSICLVLFAIIATWAVIWVKVVMKKPLFKPYELKEVMAMESESYHLIRNMKLEKVNS